MNNRPSAFDAVNSSGKPRQKSTRTVWWALISLAMLFVLIWLGINQFRTRGPLSDIEEKAHGRLENFIEQKGATNTAERSNAFSMGNRLYGGPLRS